MDPREARGDGFAGTRVRPAQSPAGRPTAVRPQFRGQPATKSFLVPVKNRSPLYKMTDGRTDEIRTNLPEKRDKSCWWLLTVNEGSQCYNMVHDMMSEKIAFPSICREVHGGLEKGEEGGNVHYQLCINTPSIRTAQVISVFKGAHIEMCRNKDAAKLYSLKTETSISDKKSLYNDGYVDTERLCRMLASEWPALEEMLERNLDNNEKIYWVCVNRLLVKQPALASQLMNTQLRVFWKATCQSWRSLNNAQGL